MKTITFTKEEAKYLEDLVESDRNRLIKLGITYMAKFQDMRQLINGVHDKLSGYEEYLANTTP